MESTQISKCGLKIECSERIKDKNELAYLRRTKKRRVPLYKKRKRFRRLSRLHGRKFIAM